MVCIYCRHDTNVVNSRLKPANNQVWRRRKCLNCKAIFTTSESVDLEKSLRVKTSSGALRPFVRDHVFLDIYRSLSHRKTQLTDSTALTDTIISQVLTHNTAVLNTQTIKQTAKEVLKNFDKASYSYYVAHFDN